MGAGYLEIKRNGKGGKIYYEHLTKTELSARLAENDIMLIPVGSTEVHGPHCPLATDSLIAERISELVSVESNCTMSRAIGFGYHASLHYGVKGTVPIDYINWIGYLRDVVKWLDYAGFKKIIFFNAHGQEAPLVVMKDQSIIKDGVNAYIEILTWYNVVQDMIQQGTKLGNEVIETKFEHADEVETSVALYLFKDLIDTKTAGAIKPVHRKSILPAELHGRPGKKGIIGYHDITMIPEVNYAPNGTFGDFHLASETKGREIVEECVKRVVSHLDWLIREYPPGTCPDVQFKVRLPR